MRKRIELTKRQRESLDEAFRKVAAWNYDWELRYGGYAELLSAIFHRFAQELSGERIPYNEVYDSALEVSQEVIRIFQADKAIGM